MAALQDGLRARYQHARAGLQQAAMHQRFDYEGKVQRQEYQAKDLVWIHDITIGQDRGKKLQFPQLGPTYIPHALWGVASPCGTTTRPWWVEHFHDLHGPSPGEQADEPNVNSFIILL